MPCGLFAPRHATPPHPKTDENANLMLARSLFVKGLSIGVKCGYINMIRIIASENERSISYATLAATSMLRLVLYLCFVAYGLVCNRNSISKKNGEELETDNKTRKKREELSVSACKTIKKESVKIVVKFN